MFLDTAGLYALLDRSDANHLKAVEQLDRLGAPITTNYVLAELVSLALARRMNLPHACTFVRNWQNYDDLKLIWVSEDLHEQGLNLLSNRGDKRYSLVDAVSFVVMRQYGETQALTTDRHFEQEGFVRLLSA